MRVTPGRRRGLLPDVDDDGEVVEFVRKIAAEEEN